MGSKRVVQKQGLPWRTRKSILPEIGLSKIQPFFDKAFNGIRNITLIIFQFEWKCRRRYVNRKQWKQEEEPKIQDGDHTLWQTSYTNDFPLMVCKGNAVSVQIAKVKNIWIETIQRPEPQKHVVDEVKTMEQRQQQFDEIWHNCSTHKWHLTISWFWARWGPVRYEVLN